MNRTTFIGRLTRDPITKETSTGLKYSRFTIAVQNPSKRNDVDFIPVVVWRLTADYVDKYLKKGLLVSVDGRFTSSSYVDENNNKRTRYEINGERIQALQSTSITSDESNDKPPTQQITEVKKPKVLSFEETNEEEPDWMTNVEEEVETEDDDSDEDLTSDVPWDVS